MNILKEIFHSVELDEKLCEGCTNCIKRCPTEAIRVRNGKAYIIKDRCIDCGECIRHCPHHAKKAIFDPLDVMNNFKYKIALPAPSLYGQFNNLDDVDIVLNALIKMGFDDVYEVADGAEIVSASTRLLISDGNLKHPVISSACPAVLRLISVRFPELIENILPLNSPMEVAAKDAREKAVQKTGLKSEDIGIIFISPCAAKNTAVKAPMTLNKSNVDAVVAIRDIYPKLLSYMKQCTSPSNISHAGKIGVSWAKSGGEASGTLMENYLAADGIENVIKVLEDLEDEKFRDLDFIELNACSGGCVGGVLTVENPYVARARINALRKYLPVSSSHLNSVPKQAKTEKNISPKDVFSLSSDVNEAMKRMKEVETILSTFPNLDCGSCGAPSCRALAEDIVLNKADETYCIFKMRDKMEELINQMAHLNRKERKDDES